MQRAKLLRLWQAMVAHWADSAWQHSGAEASDMCDESAAGGSKAGLEWFSS